MLARRRPAARLPRLRRRIVEDDGHEPTEAPLHAILTSSKEAPMSTSTITSKGQITLPKNVREHLGVREGDRLDFVIAADGAVSLLPLSGSVRRLRGLFRRSGVPAATLAEIDESIEDQLADDDLRIRSGAGGKP
jgi:AbrB family looped-hinge helix DNA binding protein